MIQTTVAASAPRPHPESAEPDSLDPLLRFAKNLETSHALVIAEHGLDLLCALVRRGCMAAATIRPRDKTDADAYSLILVPLVTELPSLEHLTRVARRSLMPRGRLIVGLPPDTSGRNPLGLALARRLRLNGFAVACMAHFSGIIVLQADLQIQPISSRATHNMSRMLS